MEGSRAKAKNITYKYKLIFQPLLHNLNKLLAGKTEIKEGYCYFWMGAFNDQGPVIGLP